MIRLVTARTALVVAAMAFQPLAVMAQTPAPAAKSVAAAVPDPALPRDTATKMELHNKELHDKLGITAAQQPQWDQFSQVMMSNAADMHRSFATRRAALATMNAADNMQSYAELSQVHAANMQKSATAFQTLYATFSPQQKITADQVFRTDIAKHHGKH